MFLILSLLFALHAAAAPGPAFRFHTFREPESLNPLKQKTSNSGYVTHQLFLPPLIWKQGKTRSGFLKSCQSSNLKTWNCEFISGLKYSDGSELKLEDFIEHLKQALNPDIASPLAADLFSIQGSRETFKREDKAKLGIERKDAKTVTFKLYEKDVEFPLRLINPLLSPYKESQNQIIGTGAYQVAEWKKGEILRLKPNSHFKGGHPERPALEVLFQAEDHVALKLFENRELDFLRRLPTLFFKKYETAKGFHRIPQIRFDYFGFSPKAWSLEERRFLAENFPYKEMGELLNARPRPGCYSLPPEWTQGPLCYPEGKGIPGPQLLKPRSLTFSQNIDDTKRVLEWLQGEVKTKWKWNLSLEGLENKSFLDRVEKRQTDFFRKGLAPDRPSCLAVLENFLPGAAENFINYENSEFQKILRSLRTESQEKSRARLCRRALEILHKDYALIPTGPIDFAILADPRWEGWSLNEINGLDLSQLHLKAKTSTKE